MRKVVIAGCTGSIGTQSIEVVQGSDELQVVALAAGSNHELLLEQTRALGVSRIALSDEAAAARAAEAWTDGEVLAGSEGLVEFNVALTEPLSAAVQIGGQTVSKWRFELIEDTVPTIHLMGSPTTTPRGAVRLVFRADDDSHAKALDLMALYAPLIEIVPSAELLSTQRTAAR